MTLERTRIAPRGDERVAPYAVLAVVLAVVGAAASIWRPLAPPIPELATDLDTFAPQVMAAVEAYRGPRYVVSATATVLNVLVPVLVIVTRRGRRLVERVAGPALHSPLRAGCVAAAVSLLVSLVTLPLAWWVRIVHDGRWGFRTASATRWFLDWLIVSGGTWLATAVLVAVLMAALRRWPRSWPFRLTLAGSLLGAVVVLMHPLVLQPILLPTSPLPAGETRDAAQAILEEQGAGDLPLHVGDASLRTTRVNAMVVGVGPTERVVLYDTLLELPREQIEAVLAHELAHREHLDLLRGILGIPTALLPALLLLRVVLGAPFASRLVAARGPTDPRLAAVVMVAAMVLELVGTPVVNVASRRAEAAADHRAIEVTGDPASRVAAARAFTVRDMAPPRGPTWARVLHGTHPTVEQRIRAAVAQADPDGLPDRAELEDAEREVAHPAVEEGPP